MFDENAVVFGWYATNGSIQLYRQFFGPHYTQQINVIGKSYFHTLDDLLKLNLSKTMNRRLQGCKEGTIIDFHYLSRNSRVVLTRLAKKEIIEINNCEKDQQRLVEINAEIEQVAAVLLEEKREIENRLKKCRMLAR